MTIGLGARCRRIADRTTATAGAVVDDDGLAEDPLQRLRDRPRREIGLAAGREWDDHGDVARGIWALREGRVGERGVRQRKCGGGLEKFAAVNWWFLPGDFVWVSGWQPSRYVAYGDSARRLTLPWRGRVDAHAMSGGVG